MATQPTKALSVPRRATGRSQARQLVVRCAVSIAALALLRGGAAAEPPSNSDSPGSQPSIGSARLPQITVEAQRRETEKRVHEFVSHVAVMSNSDESFARWDTPICPLIAGLPRDDGEFVLTRLSDRKSVV